MGHLGTRVSALLDGQLSPAEADRAWAHVHLCHLCRDAVEREGWVKTRLAGLDGTPAPAHLKGSLLLGAADPGPGWPPPHPGPRRPPLAVLGGSAAGVAVLGVLAYGLLSGPDASTPDRQPPVTNLTGSDAPRPAP
ncbi:MAG TPA: hypothetical protein VD814_10670 [Nocardioides sp.]|nr:hypothetical protein [Nocardioides sp.]